MTDVLIDRELLERCRARLYGLMQVDLSTELAALLADHAEQHLEMVEQSVEVAAVVKHDSPLPGYTNFMKHEPWMDDGLSPGWVQLMTVAQHQRILADVCQQRDKLAGLLREAKSAYTTAIHWTDMRATMVQIDTALSELTP